MSYGIAGKILRVDLTSGRTWAEPVEPRLTREFIGSRGVNARLLWDLVKPGTDPLGPENALIFGAGLLSGTEAPCSGRTTVTCKSPATGFYLKTNGGGSWGAELRFAGWSHVVVTGRADRPVYLWIDGDTVEIRDATAVWGCDVRETDARLKTELGDEDLQVACIGQGGERLVRFAGVMFSVYHAAARGGAGAVMGSKNLKAIAVRGLGEVKPAEPAAFHDAAVRVKRALLAESGAQGLGQYGTAGSMTPLNELHILTAQNFRKSSLPDVSSLTGSHLVEGGYLKRRVACFSCVFGCHRYSEVDGGPYAGAYAGGPELETLNALGLGCGVLNIEAVIKANELCNLYGLDTISTGSVIQWAMECHEREVLSPEEADGLDLSWGSEAAVLELVRRIAFREGLGDLLAEGVKRAAERVGKDSYQWAVEAKGLEQSRVDTRNAKSYALAFAVNPRGADHLHTETFAEFGLSEEARATIARITGDARYASPHLTEKRAEIVRWHEDVYAVTDALGFCAFTSTALYGVKPADLAELFSAAIGELVSEEEAMALGRRIVTLEKAFNVREGATRADDRLPWRLRHEPAGRPRGEGRNSPEELDGMLDRYYELHGWDKATSWPTAETLARLGLGEVAAELGRLGRLKPKT
jgi:aldehyde:ferredoxin oxidoreductase